MATAQPTRQKRPTDGFAGRDPQVYHPLDQLRGTIRRYVVIEGVLSAALFLTLWFTLGLALDYGVFKTLWWDWALDGSWWLRLLALVLAVGLFASILVVRIGRRVAMRTRGVPVASSVSCSTKVAAAPGSMIDVTREFAARARSKSRLTTSLLTRRTPVPASRVSGNEIETAICSRTTPSSARTSIAWLDWSGSASERL